MKKLSVIAAVLVFAVLTVFVVRFAKNEFSQRETKIVVVDPAKSIPKAEEGKVIVLSDEGYETDNDSYYEYRGELYLELQYANEHYSGGQFFYVEGSRTVVYTSSTRIVNCELGKDYDLRFGSTRSGLPTFLFVETVEEESSAEESGTSSTVSEEESVPEESSEEEEEEPDIVKLSENSFRIRGTTPLEEVQEELGVELPTEEYDTFGGMIFDQLPTVPEDGEKIPPLDLYGLNIEVEEIQAHRAEWTRVTLQPPAAENGQGEEDRQNGS